MRLRAANLLRLAALAQGLALGLAPVAPAMAQTAPATAPAARTAPAGLTPAQRAAGLMDEADRLVASGMAPRGEAMLREALALIAAPGAARPEERAWLMTRWAVALTALSQFGQATEVVREARAMAVAALGENHPTVLSIQFQLVNTLSAAGQTAAADNEAQRLLAARRARAAEDPKALATALLQAGSQAFHAGRVNEGINLQIEGLDIEERVSGDDPVRRGNAWSTFGQLIMNAGRVTDAERALRHARGLLRGSFPEDAPVILDIDEGIAVALLHQEKAAAALPIARRVVAVRRVQAGGRWQAEAVLTEALLGAALERAGQLPEAYAQVRTVTRQILEGPGSTASVDPVARQQFDRWRVMFEGQVRIGWDAAHAVR